MKSLYAVVKFPGNSREYTFLTELKLEAGDTVVVDTQHGLSVAKFVGYTVTAPVSFKLKWIVQKVDMETHEKRLKREANLKKLEHEMEKRKDEIGKIQIYFMIAQEDAVMNDILKKYIEESLTF